MRTGGENLSTMLQFKSKKKRKEKINNNNNKNKNLGKFLPPTCQEMSSNILKARITKYMCRTFCNSITYSSFFPKIFFFLVSLI
jgi:hypothetical protein